MLHHDARVAAVRQRLLDGGLDALLITGASAARWLSGLAITNSTCVVTAERLAVFSDPRYEDQASRFRELHSFSSSVLSIGGRTDYLTALKQREITRIGVQRDCPVWISRELEAHAAVFLEADAILDSLRLVKDEAELGLIKSCLGIAEKSFVQCLQSDIFSTTEVEFRRRLEFLMVQNGADRAAFDTLAVSGARSAAAHYNAAELAIDPAALTIVDFGAELQGYRSDTARTLWNGHLSDARKLLYSLAIEAHAVALETLVVGQSAGEISAAVRRFLKRSSHDHLLRHPSGHSVGLEIHEAPIFAEGNRTRLPVGAVVTLEPGVYMPGVGGARIEQMYYLEEDGPRLLNSLPVPGVEDDALAVLTQGR